MARPAGKSMMTAAVRPDLAGVIMLAGTPLSYWAGVRGKNPMRYLGGTMGGTWLTALAGDLGAGTFDGANLIANFGFPEPGEHLLDQALQRLFKGQFRVGALPRIRNLVGQPRAAQCGRNAADRRQPVRRQQARPPGRSARPRACASTCAPSACRRLSASAPGATTSPPPQQALGLDPRPLRRRRARSSPTARRSSTRCTPRSGTSASSSRARSRPRSTASSSLAWR